VELLRRGQGQPKPKAQTRVKARVENMRRTLEEDIAAVQTVVRVAMQGLRLGKGEGRRMEPRRRRKRDSTAVGLPLHRQQPGVVPQLPRSRTPGLCFTASCR